VENSGQMNHKIQHRQFVDPMLVCYSQENSWDIKIWTKPRTLGFWATFLITSGVAWLGSTLFLPALESNFRLLPW
jgi:hypothetical protein